MKKNNWSEVSAEDVVTAIDIFDSENPEYPEPRTTFLLYKGKKYPAKHIRGMAYQVHFGTEISKNDYAGGYETVRFFEKLGFETQYIHQSVNTHPIKNANPIIQSEAKIESSCPVSGEMRQEIKISKISKTKNGRIKIPVKGVIEQKNALQLLLNKLCDGDIVCEKTYPWMKTPSEITGEYKVLYDALASYRGNRDFAKKNVALRCDFVCESRKLIIEYDERQHFSEARRVSLLSYPNLSLDFDRNLWIDACVDIQAKDNQPVDRDEIRAYYDSTRDIEAAKHGYTLIRIMHGQIDFEVTEAADKLRNLLGFENEKETIKTSLHISVQEKQREFLKIGLYLQTDELYGKQDIFNKTMDIVRSSDIDILVFPEFSYIPFEADYRNTDFLDDEEIQELYDKSLALSKDIGRAIVICNEDRYGTIMSIYANAFATEEETLCRDYIKHTMTNFSACDIANYSEYAEQVFQPIIYKGWRIGLTICYDCNHSMFSRKYGLNGVDIILNSTGGNVVYNKWYKYNKARAIENNCFTFVTMGGSGQVDNPHNYVYGFTPSGKEMHPILLNGKENGKKIFLVEYMSMILRRTTNSLKLIQV